MISGHGARSFTGRRPSNQDAMLRMPEVGVFAVADGMGGLAAGEEASRAAVEWVRHAAARIDAASQRVQNAPGAASKLALLDVMGDVFRAATANIHRAAAARGVQMGATLTVGVISGSTLFIAHVGDSRLYLVRGGAVTPITQDHSVAGHKLRRGEIDFEEFASSSEKHVLYQALGPLPDVRPDFVELGLEDEDVVMLCSDGVWDHVADAEIIHLAALPDPQDAADALVRAAYDNGSGDNLTALVLRYGQDSGAGSLRSWDEVLKLTPLFSPLDGPSRMRLMPYLQEEAFAPRQVVCTEGSPGDKLYVILEGQVAVSKGDVELVRLNPGQHFGEIALALSTPRTATVTAVVTTRLMSLHRQHLEELIARSPTIGARILQRLVHHLAGRVVDLTDRVAQGGR